LECVGSFGAGRRSIDRACCGWAPENHGPILLLILLEIGAVAVVSWFFAKPSRIPGSDAMDHKTTIIECREMRGKACRI